jgi:hypothetical protein
MHLDLRLRADNRITNQGKVAPTPDWRYGYRPVLPYVRAGNLRDNVDTPTM